MAKPLETLEILRRLSNAGVEFVLIGGSAAIAYGSAVVTEDVDVCALLDHENAMRIIQSLKSAHPRWRMRPDLPEIGSDDGNLVGLKNMYLLTDIGQLDVLGELPGVCDFDQLKQRSVEMQFDDVHCRVIDIDTLIAAKRIAGRDKDLLGIRHLEAIKKQQQG